MQRLLWRVFFRPILLRLDAEVAHLFTIRAIPVYVFVFLTIPKIVAKTIALAALTMILPWVAIAMLPLIQIEAWGGKW